MKIAILSDIHDRLDHLQLVLVSVSESKAERLFFLGDFCAPFSLAELGKGFAGPVDSVFGNNDGDTFLLCQIASQHAHVTLHHPIAELEIGDRKIGLNHYPEIGLRMAESGAYDAVFSGHDHQQYQHQTKGGLWANPGEIMGRFGTVSYGLFDTDTLTFEHVNVNS